jgi:hypothetical protein
VIKNKPNAQHGDEPKCSYLHIRVTREQKARWVKQAQARCMKLSAWVCARLEEEKPVAADEVVKELRK